MEVAVGRDPNRSDSFHQYVSNFKVKNRQDRVDRSKAATRFSYFFQPTGVSSCRSVKRDY
jgi:hypothetical protein